MTATAESHNFTVIEGGRAEDAESRPGSKSWATRTRRRAKELVRSIDTSYMELSKVLWDVYDTPIDGNRQKSPIYTSWGYETFADYAASELGLEQRKAERLRLIYYTLEIELKGLDSDLKTRLVGLGYSKVRELVRVLTLRNAEHWVDFAETTSWRQLAKTVSEEVLRLKSEVPPVGGEPAGPDSEPEAKPKLPTNEPLVRETFALFGPQHENVKLALDKAAKLCQSDKKGHALDMICLDFLATNDFLGHDVDKRLRYLAKLERTTGLKLIAIDPETKDIVYGFENLKSLADS